MAVARQVNREQRSIHGESHGVPGVGILRPAVDEHQLRRPRAPHKTRDPSPGRDLDLDPAHRWRAGVGDGVFGRILSEQPESS